MENDSDATEPKPVKEANRFEPAVPELLKASGLVRGLVLLGVFFAVLLVAFMITTITDQRSQMASTARVQIEVLPVTVMTANDSRFEQLWTSAPPNMETEIAWMKGDTVLRSAVQNMVLDKMLGLPGEEEALFWLRPRVRVQSLGGNVVEISVANEGDTFLALTLAGTICNAYGDVREQTARDHSKLILSEIGLELQALERLTQMARSEMLELYEDSDIIDLAPADASTIVTPLMRAANAGSLEVDPEIAKELRAEQRRSVDVRAAKSHYLRLRDHYEEVSLISQRGLTAIKMPRRAINLLSKPRITTSADDSNTDGKFQIAIMGYGLAAAFATCFLLLLFWSQLDRASAAERPGSMR